MPVYFIQDEGGEIKIGYSDGNPYLRLNAFRTGNPRDLKLLVSVPGGAAEEKALHERFASLRMRGEWFRPDPQLLGFIDAMIHVYKDHQPDPVSPNPFGLEDDQLEALYAYFKARMALERAEDFINDGWPQRASAVDVSSELWKALSDVEVGGSPPVVSCILAAIAGKNVDAIKADLSEAEHDEEAQIGADLYAARISR